MALGQHALGLVLLLLAARDGSGAGEWLCSNGEVTGVSSRCDGICDCSDGSDEGLPTCSENTASWLKRYNNPFKRCINKGWYVSYFSHSKAIQYDALITFSDLECQLRPNNSSEQIRESTTRNTSFGLCSERAAKDDATSAEEGSATPGGLRAVYDTAASTVRRSSVPLTPPVGRALQEQQQSASSEPWEPLTLPAPQEQQRSASSDSSVSLTPTALRKQQQQSAPARSLSVADGQRLSFILESEECMTPQSFLKLEQLIGARKDTLAVKLQLSNFKTISEEELKEVVELANLVLGEFE
ncbi:hypothetical protein ONE63_003579 [Megalurothrips usitatus]|uniref:Uncharacterized protein n=1 Tax=Megalurothrips usitatus TaxID=439358 RepID=A0AAV7X489_9NEOP|nr:hypothetical protein ONE63_003579 [Megalurothrips usitatus]